MGKYKVFISFKNTDNGAETKDSVMANDLYNVLTENNIPTFFSKVSILESGEGDYRNLIDAALDECSILIAVGTKKQYLTSRWVKYEYASFHEDILSGNKDSDKCTVCSYIADMAQRDLPRPLRNLQAFEDIDALVNFVKNHLRKIDELENKSQPEETLAADVAEPEKEQPVAEEPVEDVAKTEKTQPVVEKTVEEIPVNIVNDIPVAPIETEQTQNKENFEIKSEKPLKTGKSKNKTIIGILSAVVAVAVIIIVSVAISLSKQLDIPVIRNGETVYLEHRVDDSFVSISSAELNAETMAAVEMLTELTTISIIDCTFTDDSYVSLVNMSALKNLTLENVQGITDFSFLKNCNCTNLTISNCGLTDENHSFAENTNEYCVALDLSGNAGITNLQFIQKFTKLEELVIDSTGVRSLSYLKDHPCLNVLSFNNCDVMHITELASLDLKKVYGDNNRIFDISSLAALENLTEISFANNDISEVSAEFKSLRLTKIDLNENPIVSLNGFKNLAVLAKLYVGISDANEKQTEIPSQGTGFDVLIERNAATLNELDVSNTLLTHAELKPLENAENLRFLDISGIETTDLSFILNSTLLRTIYAENCGITDISALSVSSDLADIRLAGNAIKDASTLSVSSSEYVYLDLSDNGVDFESLTFLHSPDVKFSKLLLYGNKISDLSFLSDLTVSTLGITYDESIDPDMINCEVYIENLPEYKIVAFEDAISYNVYVGRYSLVEIETT